MVFFAPVTAPWFIFKSRQASGVIPVMIFLTTFSAVGGFQFYLYANYMEKNKYSDLPPIARKMVYLADELKESTLKFDTALIKLENLSKIESRLNEIKSTIDFIDELRGIEIENKNVIIRLNQYLNQYKSFFVKKDMSWIFGIQEFYDNYNVIQHHKSLKKYLNSFEDLLRYTYINYYNINDLKSQEHLKNYDQYYLRYRRDVNSHNKFNVKRINFQNKFIKSHPKVQKYLPGTRQTESFKLWG